MRNPTTNGDKMPGIEAIALVMPEEWKNNINLKPKNKTIQ